ncbi:hypothetical protein C2G38_2047276 [Gigaspora rosea]|uniref:Uncharacterized protein n=1 Tax=Gigaspora rosea TaxID=44941 RepID=A0A397U9T0_9GLOM|nr:hypothetical protein C2G38_2047276 [Gigaspora rosea]
MICRRCLYKTDDDPDYVNLPDYLLPPERISKKDIRKFQKLVPLSKKIKLMAGVLYTRQRVYSEKPALDPDEFNKMLEENEPLLKAGLNNKFINGVKAEVGYLLDASGASSSAIETLADAGLTV